MRRPRIPATSATATSARSATRSPSAPCARCTSTCAPTWASGRTVPSTPRRTFPPMPDEFAFPQPGPDWSKPIIGPVSASSSNYVPQPGDLVIYGSPGAHMGAPIQPPAAPVSSQFLDTTVAEAQAAKIPELLQVKPPVELLDRLD